MRKHLLPRWTHGELHERCERERKATAMCAFRYRCPVKKNWNVTTDFSTTQRYQIMWISTQRRFSVTHEMGGGDREKGGPTLRVDQQPPPKKKEEGGNPSIIGTYNHSIWWGIQSTGGGGNRKGFLISIIYKLVGHHQRQLHTEIKCSRQIRIWSPFYLYLKKKTPSLFLKETHLKKTLKYLIR